MVKVGINLSSPSFWAPQWAWTNIFKQCGDWLTRTTSSSSPWNTNTINSIPKDENGYPLQLPVTIPGVAEPQIVATLMMRELNGKYPGGTYICTYDGEGDIDFRFDSRIVTKEPGMITVNVTPANEGIFMVITKSTAGNHIRNIKLVRSGDATIYSPILMRLTRLFSTIRFMDFQRTNNSPLVKWEDRATPSYYTAASNKGVSVEEMVDFANRAGANAWFCMPHMADDNFIRKFAEYVRDHFNPAKKVFIEYSNECWNGIFSQGGYCKTQGLAQNLSSDPYQAQLRFYSKRACQIFDIWSDVFGSNDRLVRVLASQATNSWTAQTILDFENAHLNADSLAIAPYFGGYLGAPGAINNFTSVEDIIAKCAIDINGPVKTWMQQNKAIAESRGLRLDMYEAGQHLVGVNGVENNDAVTALFKAANVHPGMKDLYLSYLDNWKTIGGNDANIFSSITNYNKWGSWGLLQNQQDQARLSPKLMATLDWIQRNGN